ncbi:MAG: hypothetical protein LBB31_04860 [Prevotellaceae bacterium]|jgi:hypothetical protein|nr:hypothetical protein [Prevotellaceae bacterium]
MKIIRKNKIAALLLSAVMVASCATISLFDQHAYERTTSLKVDALHVMSAATEDYAAHVQDIETLQLNLQKAYEYEKNRPNNDITTQMWALLLNPEEHLLGGFFTLWKEEGKLGETAVSRSKQQVGEAFDKIAGLESKKIKK